MNSSSAYKVTERHSVLVLNIGTFAEEDEAYELLNNLTLSLPIVILVNWIFDALLAYVYLKWFHPWRIILQEVSSNFDLLGKPQIKFVSVHLGIAQIAIGPPPPAVKRALCGTYFRAKSCKCPSVLRHFS